MVRVNGFVNSLKATGDFPNVNSMSDGDVESVVDANCGSNSHANEQCAMYGSCA